MVFPTLEYSGVGIRTVIETGGNNYDTYRRSTFC